MGQLSENGRRRIYRILLRVARADRKVVPAETAALAQMRSELGLSEAEGRALAEEPKSKSLRLGKTAHERRTVARMMVELALADGDLALREFKLLRQVASVIGLGQERLIDAIELATERYRARQEAPPVYEPSAAAREQARRLRRRDARSLREVAAGLVAAGATRELVAWGLERVGLLVRALEQTAPEHTEMDQIALTVALQVGWGWVEHPDWVRSVAVVEALDGPCSLGSISELMLEELIEWAPPTHFLRGLLTLADATSVRYTTQERTVAAGLEWLQRVPTSWFASGERTRLAEVLEAGGAAQIAAVDRAVWARRLEAWLPGRDQVFGVMALRRLALARPEAFAQLRDEVSAALPNTDSVVAAILPWSPGIVGGPDEASLDARCGNRAVAAVARFRRGDRPRRHQQLVPLDGPGVRHLRLVLDGPEDEALAEPFTSWLRDYLAQGARIADGETLEYGSFLLRIRLRGGELTFSAPDLRAPLPDRWTASLTDALRVTALQGAVARALDSDPLPARLDRELVVRRRGERCALLRCAGREGDSGFELREQRPGPPPPGVDPKLIPTVAELDGARAAVIRDTSRVISLQELAQVNPFVLPFLAIPVGVWVAWEGHPSTSPMLGRDEAKLPRADVRLSAAFEEVARALGLDPGQPWPAESWLDAVPLD